ncbi:MAG: tRNA dihydrouridine synthase DusB [Lysobacterales bacterium]|jgi:tRNA-dihydrouridine synthase B
MRIGPYPLPNNVALAPMAGVTDKPFRQLCRELGAGYVVTEMIAADPSVRHTPKTRWRSDFAGEARPVAVQIAGSEPQMLAEAARYNVAHGAQIIDINMGCPVKKVCRKLAGSALLSDLGLVEKILVAVVAAVDVPVTLKIRTGPHQENRNGVRVAELAAACGIKALAVHGRTRAQRFRGRAEYDTIKAICDKTTLPVFANGDIDTPQKAREVLDYTGAAGVMIGRGAQGNPWIFREISHYLASGRLLPPPGDTEVFGVMREHLQRLYRLYGERTGVRVARKHIGWYLKDRHGAPAVLFDLMRAPTAREQISLLASHFRTRRAA